MAYSHEKTPTVRKAFVLLSGGLDSTTCLHKAIYDYGAMIGEAAEDIDKRIDLNRAAHAMQLPNANDPITWVEAVSINYGQRHKKEMDYAKATCDSLGIEHTVLDVGALLRGDTVMLTDDSRGKVDVPNISYSDIQGVSPTYVPFRNGLMLSALTAHAQKWVNTENQKIKASVSSELTEQGLEATRQASIHDEVIVGSEVRRLIQEVRDLRSEGNKPQAGIYFGAHAEDAANWAYPDCTPEFIGAMANAIFIGSYMQIRLHTPIQWLVKHEIVDLGQSLRVDFANTWSCYKGEDKHCGVCPTCRSRKEGFFVSGVDDPTKYAESQVAAE